MNIYNLYVNHREVYLQALKQELEQKQKDYVLIENELHYEGAIYRFFTTPNQMTEREVLREIQVVFLEEHLEKRPSIETAIENLSQTELKPVYLEEEKREPNPIYIPSVSKKKQLQKINRNYRIKK